MKVLVIHGAGLNMRGKVQLKYLAADAGAV